MSQPTIPPPQPAPQDPTIALYWSRLQSLLQSATQTAAALRPTPSEAANATSEKGCKGRVAIDLQGRTAIIVEKTVASAAADNDWRAAWESGGLGTLVEYGVPQNLAVWVASQLANPPTTQSLPLPEGDPRVQNVRIFIWESEPACLPVTLMERLVTVRRVMRRFKQRIELCTKILCAMEGRGRKVTQVALDKLKLALEKADLQADQDEKKRLAAEAVRQGRAEKARARREKAQEKQMKSSVQRKKEKEDMKRKRQENAQASFMKRFVKQKATKSSLTDVIEIDMVENENNPKIILSQKDNRQTQLNVQSQVEGVLPAAADRDVMSVSWWLLSEMERPDLSDFETVLKTDSVKFPVPSPPTLRNHLTACAAKRIAAERRLPCTLSRFRRSRTVNTEDRTPYFINRRAIGRGFTRAGPIKLLQFSENHRPGFFGILQRHSKAVRARRPFAKDGNMDYEYDSADEWEDEEDAEDLCDVEGQEERAKEDAELRLLYGSDEEDDDDFLDDGDAEDDGEDDSDDDETDPGTRGEECGSISTPKAGTTSPEGDVQQVDLTLSPASLAKKKQAMRGNAGQKDAKNRKRKRRNGGMKQHVTIHGVSIPGDEESSQLDEYMVSIFEGAPLIKMFDPSQEIVTVESTSIERPKPPVHRSRVIMDEAARLELAIALNGTGSRDKIVHQFCESRRLRGLVVPPKSEVIRAIGEIATREKRGTDTRAGWYLNDQLLASKLRDMSQRSPEAPNLAIARLPHPCPPTIAK